MTGGELSAEEVEALRGLARGMFPAVDGLADFERWVEQATRHAEVVVAQIIEARVAAVEAERDEAVEQAREAARTCCVCHTVAVMRAEVLDRANAVLTAERDHALASAASMDHFAEVAVRCEAKSNEYAAENRRLGALVEAGLALADEWERSMDAFGANEIEWTRVADLRAALGGTK
jgi:hypothetical protein